MFVDAPSHDAERDAGGRVRDDQTRERAAALLSRRSPVFRAVDARERIARGRRRNGRAALDAFTAASPRPIADALARGGVGRRRVGLCPDALRRRNPNLPRNAPRSGGELQMAIRRAAAAGGGYRLRTLDPLTLAMRADITQTTPPPRPG